MFSRSWLWKTWFPKATRTSHVLGGIQNQPLTSRSRDLEGWLLSAVYIHWSMYWGYSENAASVIPSSIQRIRRSDQHLLPDEIHLEPALLKNSALMPIHLFSSWAEWKCDIGFMIRSMVRRFRGRTGPGFHALIRSMVQLDVSSIQAVMNRLDRSRPFK